MNKLHTGAWMSDALKDMLGREYKVGDKVVKAYTSGRAVNLCIREVGRMENGKMWLDDSKVAVNFPGRMLIVTEIVDKSRP